MQSGALTSEEQQEAYNVVSLTADYILGCNPLGMVWITGLGSRYPRDPLHLDSLTFLHDGYGLLPGIPVYGPVSTLQDVIYMDYGKKLIYPAVTQMPPLRRYVDIHGFVTMNEFDVSLQATHTQLFGVLLAGGFEPPASWLPFGAEHRNTLAPRQ